MPTQGVAASAPNAEWPQFAGYTTETLLGRGGFGTVYRARAVDASARRVAIKVAHSASPTAIRRLTREVRALQLIGSPHVPSVFELHTVGAASPYVVMEFVEGVLLADLLDPTNPSLSVVEVCKVACELLKSLGAVHTKGFVHGDLKPENVLVQRDFSRATILDLGLTRKASASEVRHANSTPSTMSGTLEYMAPEQCESHDIVGIRADLYAVGVIVYEMVTGRVPFWGPPAAVREGHTSRRPARMTAMLHDEIETPPRVRQALRTSNLAIPAALEDVVLRCLEKDPRERFSRADELREALEAVARNAADTTPSNEPPAVVQRQATSHSATERRTVSSLHFASPLDPIALRARIEAIGGYVMRATGGWNVVAFGHDSAENPARLSLRAAQDLVERRICERVWVDLATVSMTIRPDGSRRLLSPQLARVEHSRLPEGSAPIVLSSAARAVLTEADLQAVAEPYGAPMVVDREFAVVEDPTTRLGHAVHPLVGRDDTLEALAACALRATRDKVPSVMAVIGEAGHGKSHLRRLLVERLRSLVPAIGVIDLRARESLGGGGDCVRDLLSEALGLPPMLALHQRQAALRDCLGTASSPEAEAALALALGWVEPHAEETTDFPGLRALEAAPFALRATLTVAAGEALRRCAERLPLCIVLDDAQHADDATLSILEHATLAEAQAPIFVCTMARPVFQDIRPSWGERASRHEIVELGPLDTASASALCRALLYPAENVPESAVRRLVERTQGIPLLLVELVRGLKNAGIVRRFQGARGFYVATDELDRLPDSPLIEWLAHREIDALSPAERAHARLVATVGVEVTPDEITGILRRLENSGDASDF
ncbi:MAG TPA: protein kinase, partial [Polyangium sp.]|nr:protein kinase [Polyangium sp.]